MLAPSQGLRNVGENQERTAGWARSSEENLAFLKLYHHFRGFPAGSVVKRICLQCRRPGFDPRVRKIPWRRKWQPTPVFLPGESHGQRSLAGSSPWGRRVGQDCVTKHSASKCSQRPRAAPPGQTT